MEFGFIGTNEVLEIGLTQLLNKTKENYSCININTKTAVVRKREFDFIFIDLGSDYRFGGEKLAEIKQLSSSTPIMLYISEHNLPTIKQFLSLGIQSVMTYECDFDEIYESMQSIINGGKAYCTKVLDILVSDNKNVENLDCLPVQLSKREIEVLQLVVQGKSSKMIAEELFVSYHTINTHRKNIIKKVGVSNVSELILFAQNTGLITV